MRGGVRPIALGRGAKENNRAEETVISLKSGGSSLPGITEGGGTVRLCPEVRLCRVEEVCEVGPRSSSSSNCTDSLSVLGEWVRMVASITSIRALALSETAVNNVAATEHFAKTLFTDSY